MKKNFLLQRCIIAVLLAFFLANNAGAEGTLKVGGTGDIPPVYFRDVNAELVGFDIEVLREIGQRIGKSMAFTVIDWNQKTELLNSGKIDVIASAMSVTDERQAIYAITKPVINNYQAVTVPADSPIREQGDLSAKTVCTIKGSFVIAEVEKFRGKSGPIAAIKTGGNEFCLISMMEGEVDATVGDWVAASYYVKHNPGVFRMLPGNFGEDKAAFGLRKNETALRDQFDKALADMENDGTMKTIRERWFGKGK